jgi:hypothetical protein
VSVLALALTLTLFLYPEPGSNADATVSILTSANQRIVRTGLVPGVGLEPTQYCYHWCLRPARLPVPPSGLNKSLYVF